MHQLTGLDAGFLALETSSVYGHVGSLIVLDGATMLTLAELTAHISSRLQLLPPYRRRLAPVPLGLDQPYWIEDPDFDLEYHVRELALPSPGSHEQLAEQAARLHARALDRRHPLWETYLIHGLAGGKQAIYSKVHHAAIDGVAGSELLAAVVDLTPESRVLTGDDPWTPDSVPSDVVLTARALATLATHPLRAVRLSRDLAASAPGVLALAAGAVGALPLVGGVLRPKHDDPDALLPSPNLRAPSTPFNKAISPHRRWGFGQVDLDDVKRIRKGPQAADGLTVNDVVIAMCAGGLRRWLSDHDALPPEPLVAAVPISLRQKGESGGNRVSTMIAAVPTQLASPRARLAASRAAMAAAKNTHGALPADLIADVTQFAAPAIAGSAARLAARVGLLEHTRPFNLFISNVPGPDLQLYIAGSKIEAIYPLSAIADGTGLNITLMGLGGKLNFGLVADRKLVPDVDLLTRYVIEELDVLAEAVGA